MSAHPFRRVARNGLAALVVGLARYARHRWLPHPCTVCGSFVAAGQDEQHAKWHWHVAMAMWGAGGGRGRKPKRPPHMATGRRRTTDEAERVVGPRETGAYARAAEEMDR